MPKMPAIQIVNANTPEGVGKILCRGMMEFFINHMGPAARENFGNFMAAMEELMLSPAGIEAQRKGWDRIQEELLASDHH
jgi:hypothetical protein